MLNTTCLLSSVDLCFGAASFAAAVGANPQVVAINDVNEHRSNHVVSDDS